MVATVGQQDLLIAVVRALEEEGANYWITGSTASSILGEPRTTHDIDVVAALSQDILPRLAVRFPEPKYMFDLVSARNAVASGEMFNVLDVEGGDKVDFWTYRNDAFAKSCMARRKRLSALGISMWVASAEDLILSKLKWSKMSGGSDRQLRDSLGVYLVQQGTIDEAYLDRWAGELEVAVELARIRNDAVDP